MTSRRNFVISAGTLLTGSGAFLGSGAFGVGNAGNSENWVPVGVRTPSSEGFESSVGLPQQADDGGTGGDGGTGDTDGDDSGGGDQGTEDGTDDGSDDPPDGRDGDGGDEDPSDGDDEGDTGDGGDDDDRDRDDGTDDREDDGRQDDGGGGGSDSGGGGSSDSGGGGGGGGGSEPGGETSVRLEATGSEVLSSEHVLTAEDGTLRGLRLENLNMNALTYVGETSDGRFPDPGAGDRVAFLAVNDGDVAVDLSVDVDGSAPQTLNFPAWVDTGVSGPRQRDLTSVPVAGLPPGGVVRVVVEVDTTVADPVPDDAVEAVTFVADPV